MDDIDIIELYHRRDESAIAETDRNHGAFCRTVSFNLLSSREDAEECVNDTWLAAWNSMPPERPASLRAFLGRIVRNISIGKFRKNRAQKRYSGIEVMLSELGECVPGDCAEKEIERLELSGAISRWLSRLDRESRSLFVRRYWYGMQVQEIASERGESPNSVAKRMQKLRESLRRELEKEGERI